MEQIIEKNKCTGCTTCMNICPNNAITMKCDNEGFKYPIINKSNCVDCGLCKKMCPVLNKIDNKSINKCCVAYNKDRDSLINKASSGSIFELLAKEVLKENGIVIGAAFDNVYLKHIAIDKIEDLDKLKGSKYLQSDLNEIFKYIKEHIKTRKILFVGTPCQVSGLKAFIKNDFGNLICVDLICHGVPSPKLFDKYINEIQTKHNKKVIEYNFRDKITGWDTYSNTIILENGVVSEVNKNNDYMKLFISDVALRSSCYDCHFKLGNKSSDITLGDFWGVKNFYPEMYNTLGTSAVIINTKLGIEMFEKIKPFIIEKECKLDEIIQGNPSLIKSSVLNPKREVFFKEMNNLLIEQLVRKYVPKNHFYKRVLRKLYKVFNRVHRRKE